MSEPLTKQDLVEAMDGLRQDIRGSEERIIGSTRKDTSQQITASEERTREYTREQITASEERIVGSTREYMREQITASEERIVGRIVDRIVDGEERILNLMQDFTNRTDERFSALDRKVDGYAMRGEVRLRRLETSDNTTTDRLASLEQQVETLDKRVRRLEDRPGHVA